ncbi:tRNA-specific 2-thiouridylase MnmA [bioreactor metagenome]|uniref:tRNA-specific 2-thiouridylase MnmA n=1 Tax=bioreactor metagenome TaxID=1076179 RepID=A0A645CZX8_9ZZZZ
MKDKVVVALSGGVDSSVAAALAVRAGCEVIGVTLRLKHPDPAFSAAQLCASKNDEAAVAQAVRSLGIEHHYLEGFARFRELVLEPAAREYLAGRTPNPCCDCNLLVKFGALVDFAEERGAARVLTGHYAKISREPAGFVLRRGDDPAKDQSYFLYRLTQRELSKLSFPVGGMEKSEVRKIAAELGLATSQKPDSQDACFQVEGECFGETLRRLCGHPAEPGWFVYRGRRVGRHAGVHAYTVGQRRGLNVALGVPAYVMSIDPESGVIELETDPAALLSRSFRVSDVSWQLGIPPEEGDMEVQIRYRSHAVHCRIEPVEGGAELRVVPAEPLRAVTPGQAAVFYRGPALLGGGVIGHAD